MLQKKWKKISIIILFFLCTTILTGCMRFTTKVKVKTNGKADISIIYAISKELSEMGGKTFSKDEVESIEAKGWQCDNYSEDNFVGYRMSKNDVDLYELANAINNSGEESLNPDQFKVQKNGFNYIIDWKMLNDEQKEQMNTYKNYFNISGGYMSFVLELPFRATNSNATSVSEDGKTLKWDLLALPEEGIHVEFSLPNILFILPDIPFILECIAAIVLVIIAIIKKRSKNKY